MDGVTDGLNILENWKNFIACATITDGITMNSICRYILES
jgi:hypothetical protein